MLKFMKNKSNNLSWTLLALLMLSAPSVSFGMEGDGEDISSLASQNPFSVMYNGLKNYFIERLPGSYQFPIENSNEVSGTFNKVKNNLINYAKEISEDIQQSNLLNFGFGDQDPEFDNGNKHAGTVDIFKDYVEDSQPTKTVKNQTILRKQVAPILEEVKDTVADIVSNVDSKVDSKITMLMPEVKKLQDNILIVNENINSKWNTILENKYQIAGGTALAIVATIVLVKATRLAFDKFVTGSKIIGPQFLVETKNSSLIAKKVKALLGIKKDYSLFLNKDIASEVANYVLLHKTVSNSDFSNLNYKNLVLTGADNFVKTKIAESVARQSQASLVKINSHSMLFDQNISDDQKRILVKSFFDKISRNKTVIFVNLDHTSLQQLENNGFNKIIADIANQAKTRSHKVSFIFACPDMSAEYSKLLHGSYDQVINIQNPDKNAREQIIKHAVNKLILNREKAILEKARIKSAYISDKTKEDFKSYLTQEKLSFISDKLEGQSYQSVENFVKQLEIMITDRSLIPFKNYDLVLNILLGKSNIKNGISS